MAVFAGRYGPEPFIDRRGNERSDAQVTVYEANGTTVSTLWADAAKTVVLANPLPTEVVEVGDSDWSGLSANGNGAFYATPGVHVIVTRIGGVEVSRINVEIDAPTAVDTAANLAALNPILAAGQFGYASDTDVLKIGDGVTAWNSLISYVPRQDPVRAETAGVQQTGLTTTTDVTSLALPTTFTVGTIPWVGQLHLGTVFAGTAGNIVEGQITDAANTPVAQEARTIPTANGIVGVDVYERITTPGVYSRKARIARTVGVSNFGAGSTDPQYVMFLEYHQEP